MTVRPSATIILVRRAPELEVYLVERNLTTRFFPGYHAFPGGVLDAGETRERAAVRELLEETGVRLDEGALVPAGRLVTPEFGPTRYDTSFFVAELPAGQEPRVEPGELISGAWWSPRAALEAWRERAMPIPPPTLAYLRLLEAHGTPEGVAEAARSTDGRPHHERFHIEIHPGVYVLPLRAPTLPPATTQNCYVFDGDPILVVDPGTPIDAERIALTHTLDRLVADGRKVRVLLTHHHRDHVGSAQAVRERYGARIAASEATRAEVPDLVDDIVKDGDEIDIGVWGATKWRVQAIATPGHTKGHLAFRDARWGAILAGDLVSGVSTILIDPDEGDMSAYMATLQRCADLRPPIVLPGHGPALPGGAFAKTLEHRRMREEKARAALGADPRSIVELVPIVYDDTPREAWPLAERSLESVLRKLERDGKARREGARWISAR